MKTLGLIIGAVVIVYFGVKYRSNIVKYFKSILKWKK